MPVREIAQEPGFWLATTPATLLLRQLTYVAMALLLLTFVATLPFTNIPLAESAGFIPFIGATMFVTELVTALLLYTQFAIVRSRAILILANGYLFTSLTLIAYILTFPSTFTPDSLLGAGLQTAAWLYIIWHFGFPTSVIVYALMKNRTMDATGLGESSVKAVICWNVVVVFGLIVALTWSLIAADAFLPRLLLDGTKLAPLAIPAGMTGTLVCGVALVLLYRDQRSRLDCWLMVAVFAATLETSVVMILTARFTVGWYVVRLFWVTASAVVLVGLLAETTMIYIRLANAIVLLRRERGNRLMSLDAATSAMAHEIKQTLSTISLRSQAALMDLQKTSPDLKEVRDDISSILDSTQRLDDIISSVRKLFKQRGDDRTMVRIDDIVEQVLSLLYQELQTNKIVVATEFQHSVPEVHADRTQLQQVILNLVRNAIDAMIAAPLTEKRLRLATSLDGRSSVLLRIQDSGPGIIADDPTRVFEPFFTTKTSGMGLGLSICRTIVEDHGGYLQLVKTDSEGCVFVLALPIPSQIA